MNLKEAHEFYKIIKDKFSTESRFENFFDYFEDTWIALTDSDKTKYDFDGIIKINLILKEIKLN